MGCGKTSVGRALQRLASGSGTLPIRFADLDEEIVRREGRNVQEIFRTRGETAFRAAEYEALADLIGSYSGDETLLIALGGGTLMQPASRELVRACCHCIYLRASVQTLAAHLSGAGAGGSTLETFSGAVADGASSAAAALSSGRAGSTPSAAATLPRVGAGSTPSAAAPEVAARPLLAGPGTLEEKIARILADRTAVYESTARHIIDTDGRTISDLAAAILPLL